MCKTKHRGHGTVEIAKQKQRKAHGNFFRRTGNHL